MLNSQFQEFLYIRDLALNAATQKDTFVDIWVLLEGLDASKISTLREVVRLSQDKPVCCYDFVEGGQFYVKPMLRGFARVIVKKKNNGIMSFQEGRFKDGAMYEFGRFLNLWP